MWLAARLHQNWLGILCISAHFDEVDEGKSRIKFRSNMNDGVSDYSDMHLLGLGSILSAGGKTVTVTHSSKARGM